ncbi:cytochrome c [Tianweitania sediminis]|uniref:Cytochrome c n=1 Tax=Tianweitania sediminis TaxID=1502156 RepID=A0A8J7UM66_9HYPH|nr:cytochrome c [Tianweitania sediminis]MBP0441494.1 cytochrome c [Tianweitania sediminis]
MRQMAEAAKTIDSIFNERVPFDGGAIRRAADVLAAHSGAAMATAFERPDGSSTVDWEELARDRTRFDALASELNELARLFGEAVADAESLTPDLRMRPQDGAPGGSLLGARRSQVPAGNQPAEHLFHMMLETCTRCHAAFRRAG